MAHTFGNVSALQNHTADPATFSFTPDAGSTVLVLFIIGVTSTDRTGGAPTFNGVAMTQADSTRKAASAPETTTELWYLLSPPITTANISIPNTGVLQLRSIAATGKAGAGTTSALDVANGGSGTSINPSVSVTTNVNGDIIFAGIGSGANTWAPTSQDGTILSNFDGGNYGGGAQYLLQPTAGTQAMGWAFSAATDDWAAVVAAFKEVAGSNLTLTLSDDTSGLADSVGKVGGQLKTVSDSVSLTDTLAIAMEHRVPLADNASLLADGEARVIGAITSLTDTLETLADVEAHWLAYLLALTDSAAANWADAHQLLLAQFLALSDSHVLTDGLGFGYGLVLEEYASDNLSDALDFLLLVPPELEPDKPLTLDDSTGTLNDSLEIGYGLQFTDPPPVVLPGYRTSNAAASTFATSNPSASISTEPGDLLVLFAFASGNTNDTPTASESGVDASDGAYDLIGVASAGIGGVDYRLSAFVRTTLISTGTAGGSGVVTIQTGSNSSRSAHVYAIKGMTQAGLAAIRSFGLQDTQSASTTPAPTLDQAALTTSITLIAVGSADTTTEPPIDWIERHDTSTTTPTLSLESASRDSGFTGTTITYDAAQGTEFCSFAIELNTPIPFNEELSDSLELGLGGIDLHPVLSDTLATLVDSLTLTLGYELPASDVLNSLSDNLELRADELLAFSDSLTLTDSESQILELRLTLAETITLTDTLQLGYGLSFDDVTSLSDSAAVITNQLLEFTDSLSITDAVSLQLVHLLTFDDSLTLTDSESHVLGHRLLFADVIDLDDDESHRLDQLLSLDDTTANLADAYVQIADGLLNFTDTLALDDSIQLGYGLVIDENIDLLIDAIATSAPQGPLRQVGVTDSIDNLVDSVALRLDYLLTIADDVDTLNDSLALVEGLLTSLADLFSLTDSATSALGHLVSLADALTLDDNVQLRLGYELRLSDLVTLTDTIEQLFNYQLTLADNAGLLADSTAKSVGLDLIIADNSPALAESIDLFSAWLLQLADILTLNDALTKSSAGLLALDDALAITDSLAIDLRGPDLDAALGDSLSLTDALSLTLGNELRLQIEATDTLTLVDHYFDLRHPYTPSAKRHIVVSSRARVTRVPARDGVRVPANDRTTRVE